MAEMRNDLTWNKKEIDSFISAFERLYPCDGLASKLHDTVQKSVSKQIANVRVQRSKRRTIEDVWNYCFENAFFGETLKEVYEELVSEAVKVFMIFNYDVSDAIRVLENLYIDDTSSVAGNTVRCYFKEMEEIITTKLFERYIQVTRYDNQTYMMLLSVSRTK